MSSVSGDVVESIEVGPLQVQRAKGQKRLDMLLNGALGLTVCLSIAVFTLPIFGNQLYAPQSPYDFGIVKAGTQIERKFTVRNLHPWTIVVSELQSDCGCTESIVGKTPPFRLAPFQSVDVVATLSTNGKQGHVKQAIYVSTNENQQGTPLVLQGEVR